MKAGILKKALADIDNNVEAHQSFPQPIRTVSLIEGPIGSQYSYESSKEIAHVE